MTCYNHSSTMGTVLSHDYVTSLYVNNGVSVSEGLKLYGNEKKCRQKGVEFKTKVQLACELIEEHVCRANKLLACGIPGLCVRIWRRRAIDMGITGLARSKATESYSMRVTGTA